MFLFESSEQKRLRTDMEKQMETCLSNTQKYPEAMQAIAKNINNQKVIQMVVDNVKSTIKDSDYQPIRKFQSIKLLRDLMKTQNKNLGKYVVKKILKRLAILAEHRADSGDEQRGRDIFGKVKKDQEQYAIKFLNQLLRAIQQWGKNWPKVSEGTHQQFHKAYKDLVINGVRFPKEQPKLNQATFRNSRQQSLNKYSSVPAPTINRVPKKMQETPPKPPVVQKKITPKASIQSKSSVNIQKINEYFQQVKDNLTFLKETLGQADQEMWPTIKDIIEQLSQNISSGNQIVAQLTQNNQNQEETINKIQQCFDFSQSILKDMRKADRNTSQFGAFKNKYTKMSNKLLDSLAKRLKVQKVPQKKVQTKPQQKPVVNSDIKRLSIPIVNTANQYNSRSGKDGWVIKQKQEFNSNSHKSDNDQQANPANFGSFGIGGIGGQKFKRQQSSDQKKKNSSNQVNVESQNISKVATERVVQKKNADEKMIKTQTAIQQKFQKQISHQANTQQKVSQFGGFQLSGDKDKPKQEQFFQEPANSNHQKTKNMFNDSDFKQKSVEGDKSKDSADFFQQIQKNNQQTGNRLPTTKRVKTINQGKNQVIGNTQNPFALQMNSQIQSQGLSAFNKDKSQNSMSKSNPFQAESKSKILSSVVQIPQRKNSTLSASVQGNPFQTSNLKNPWDQSFQKKTDNPFEDKKSVTSKQSKKSIVNNFDFNKSFTKTQRSNPFQTSTQQGKKKVEVMSNPFSSDNNNNSQIGGEKSNPFQTTVNQQFNPPQTKKMYDSVSQQNSFKKIDIGSLKVVQIQNPFENNTNFDPIRESWKLQPKQFSHNQSGINFDAFDEIPKKRSNVFQNKNSINFMQNSQKMSNDDQFNQFGRHSKQSHDRSVHFSQFGQPQQENLSNIFKKDSLKQGHDKSLNFQDFQQFPNKIGQVQPSNKQNGFRNEFSAFDITKNSKDIQERQQQQGSKSGFSGFNLSQQRQKKSQNSNNSGVDFNAFQNFDKKKVTKQGSKQIFDMKSQRSQQDHFDLKLSLRSNNESQYPKFNQPGPNPNQKSQLSKQNQNNFNLSQTNKKNQQSLSIKLEDFSPVGKKGNLWDPLHIQGVKNSSRVYNVSDYDLSQKAKKMMEVKKIYQQEMAQFKQIKIKQLQTRKLYQEKYNRINDMISQANSYKNMLQKLKETNHIKQDQIFALNEKIKVANNLKQKILQKEKQLFQLMKNQNAKQQKKEVSNRSNATKWQIFNRNLQQMRSNQQSKYQSSYNNNITRFA